MFNLPPHFSKVQTQLQGLTTPYHCRQDDSPRPIRDVLLGVYLDALARRQAADIGAGYTMQPALPEQVQR